MQAVLNNFSFPNLPDLIELPPTFHIFLRYAGSLIFFHPEKIQMLSIDLPKACCKLVGGVWVGDLGLSVLGVFVVLGSLNTFQR